MDVEDVSISDKLRVIAGEIEKKLTGYIAGTASMDDLQERLNHEMALHEACRASLVDLKDRLAAVKRKLTVNQKVFAV